MTRKCHSTFSCFMLITFGAASAAAQSPEAESYYRDNIHATVTSKCIDCHVDGGQAGYTGLVFTNSAPGNHDVFDLKPGYEGCPLHAQAIWGEFSQMPNSQRLDPRGQPPAATYSEMNTAGRNILVASQHPTACGLDGHKSDMVPPHVLTCRLSFGPQDWLAGLDDGARAASVARLAAGVADAIRLKGRAPADPRHEARLDEAKLGYTRLA